MVDHTNTYEILLSSLTMSSHNVFSDSISLSVNSSLDSDDELGG